MLWALYSTSALVLGASLGGAPNYPESRAAFNERAWLLSLAASVCFVLLGHRPYTEGARASVS